MKTTTILFVTFFFSISLHAMSFCNQNYHCAVDSNNSQNFGATPAGLTCQIPNIPNLTIKASQNVFDRSGNLISYWDQNNICDVK